MKNKGVNENEYLPKFSDKNELIYNEIEVNTNKVTSISSSSTDDEYPSAKCVYDIVGDIESLLAEV